MRVQRVVNDLLREHRTRNPEQLAELLNIEVVYLELHDNDGYYLDVDGRKFIFIKDDLKYSQERFFVIAHELYHALAHSESGFLYHKAFNYHGRFEREANLFAIYLLCDIDTLNDEDTVYSLFKKNYIPLNMLNYI